MSPARPSVRPERALLAAIHCWAVYGVTRLPAGTAPAPASSSTSDTGRKPLPDPPLARGDGDAMR
jgi:hypothetical protein